MSAHIAHKRVAFAFLAALRSSNKRTNANERRANEESRCDWSVSQCSSSRSDGRFGEAPPRAGRADASKFGSPKSSLRCGESSVRGRAGRCVSSTPFPMAAYKKRARRFARSALRKIGNPKAAKQTQASKSRPTSS